MRDRFLGAVAVLSLTGLVALVIPKYFVTATVVPSAIRSQVPFTMLVPGKAYPGSIDKGSFAYDQATTTVSFALRPKQASGVIKFSEGNSPALLSHAVQLEQFTSKLERYDSFHSPLGDVYLTRPPELSGKQSAVLISHSTLLFVRPDWDLSRPQWQELFANIEVVK